MDGNISSTLLTNYEPCSIREFSVKEKTFGLSVLYSDGTQEDPSGPICAGIFLRDYGSCVLVPVNKSAVIPCVLPYTVPTSALWTDVSSRDGVFSTY